MKSITFIIITFASCISMMFAQNRPEIPICEIIPIATQLTVGQEYIFTNSSSSAQCSQCYDWDVNNNDSDGNNNTRLSIMSDDRLASVKIRANNVGPYNIRLTVFTETGCHICNLYGSVVQNEPNEYCDLTIFNNNTPKCKGSIDPRFKHTLDIPLSFSINSNEPKTVVIIGENCGGWHSELANIPTNPSNYSYINFGNCPTVPNVMRNGIKFDVSGSTNFEAFLKYRFLLNNPNENWNSMGLSWQLVAHVFPLGFNPTWDDIINNDDFYCLSNKTTLLPGQCTLDPYDSNYDKSSIVNINPNNLKFGDEININSTLEINKIEVFDSFGRNLDFNFENGHLLIKQGVSGVAFIKLFLEDGNIIVEKIVIKN